MLTKTDLSQIRKVIREEIENEADSLKKDLQGEMKLVRMEIQRDVRKLSDEVKDLNIRIRKIEKDIKTVVNFFDKESLKTGQRISQIEDHLKISSPAL
ncbi:hypothetical protein ACFL0Y_00085 [Patescibacteria group bacterium]